MKTISKLKQKPDLRIEDIEAARRNLRSDIKKQQDRVMQSSREAFTLSNSLGILSREKNSFASPLSLITLPFLNKKSFLFMQAIVLAYKTVSKFRRAARK